MQMNSTLNIQTGVQMQIHGSMNLLMSSIIAGVMGKAAWVTLFVESFAFLVQKLILMCPSVRSNISGFPDTPRMILNESRGDDGSLHRHSNSRQMFIMGTLIKGQNFKTWKATRLLLMELRWMTHLAADSQRIPPLFVGLVVTWI